jgi:hypothetical protein
MKNRPWPLILGLAAFALIRPVLSMTGLSEWLGQSVTSILTTLLISVVWLVVVVRAQVPQPLSTLVWVGVSYGVFAILLSAVFSPLLSGQWQGPATNPLAIVSVLITNAIWGLIVGVVAMAWMRVR